MATRTERPGITLVQFLVVMGIIAILISLLVPAIQKARESANRAACQNNLRQIVQALHQYEGNTRELPSLSTYYFYWQDGQRAATYNNWLTVLLPYLEQQGAFNSYNMNTMFYNNTAAIAAPVKTFLCPSVPRGSPLDDVPYWHLSGAMLDKSLKPYDQYLTAAFTDAVSDYGGFDKVNDGWLAYLSYPQESPPLLGLLSVPQAATSQELDGWLSGETIGPRSSQTKFADATDGLSNTILFVEDGGRPQKWVAGKLIDANANIHGAGWADPDSIFTLDGTFFPACMINCENDNEIYSFHTGGANFPFADGSVRFISSSVSLNTLVALLTAHSDDFAEGDY